MAIEILHEIEGRREEEEARLAWSTEDDARLKVMKDNEGKSWADIAKCFPNRTQGACEKRYYADVKDGAKKRKKTSGSSNAQLVIIG
jgi:hypothetical protein